MNSDQTSKLGAPGTLDTHVLLVEHDADIAWEIVDFLGRRGISCRTCATAAQASAAFAERRPDVVVLNAAVSAGNSVVFCLTQATTFPDVHWLLLDAGERLARLRHRALGDRVCIVHRPVSLRFVHDFVLAMGAIRRPAVARG